MEWGVVVPVKRLALAKSRLAGRFAEERAALALAFATDTLEAVRSTSGVATVAVVGPDAATSDVLRHLASVTVPDPAGGLNAAVRAGAAALRRPDPRLAVAVVVSDLPSLRPAELAAALAEAARSPRAFVVDRQGSGTTFASALAGHSLPSQFGSASARAHARSGCRSIGARLLTLRTDVDTEDDLAAAVLLGVGPATAGTLARVAAGEPG